tara:strand:- start:1180 stop:1410 length:231 start_codon:yes stop_codon:yes gene_type:complete
MNQLAQYFVEQLKYAQKTKNYRKINRLTCIDMNNYFTDSGKIELGTKYVLACHHQLPIPERIIYNNDMSKYKLKKK